MKNRFWLIALLLAATLLISACEEGAFPGELPENLEGLEALEVEISGEGQSLSVDEIEISGVVSTISDGGWTIASQSFLITPDTEIKGGLEVGDIAKVHAYLGDEGEVFAREIEPAEEDDDSDEELTDRDESENEVEFVGVVVNMGDTTWTVADREIQVTSQTELKGAITDGALVKIHAFFSDGEGLLAREIELAEEEDLDEDDADDDSDLKVEGIAEDITEDSVVVDGITYYFADFTEFEDEIESGDFVEIYFLEQDDGTFVVREIELEGLDDDDPGELNDDDELDDDDDEYGDDDDDDDYDDDDHDEEEHEDDHHEDDDDHSDDDDNEGDDD